MADDAAEIARVHVECWEETYGGWLPPAYLAARTVAAREAFWTDQLREWPGGLSLFVACEDDGAICGFASGGPELTDRLGVDGELYSLYLLAAAQGRGWGRVLTESVLGELRALGARRIAVWVLEDNPACGFYEHMGGRRIAEKRVEMGGTWFTQIAYSWGPE